MIGAAARRSEQFGRRALDPPAGSVHTLMGLRVGGLIGVLRARLPIFTTRQIIKSGQKLAIYFPASFHFLIADSITSINSLGLIGLDIHILAPL